MTSDISQAIAKSLADQQLATPEVVEKLLADLRDSADLTGVVAAFQQHVPGYELAILGADSLPATDSLPGLEFRAHRALAAQSPHLEVPRVVLREGQNLLVIREQREAENFQTFISDIGPMPARLACEFMAQAARGLEAAHARNLWHGDPRPCHVTAGPLVAMSRPRDDGTPRYRPAPTAVVKIAKLGLVPLLPPASEWTDPASWEHAAFLPPERFSRVEAFAPGDIYILAGTLYFLLTGRGPFTAARPEELLAKKQYRGPAPLSALRPDVPADLAVLLQQMLHADPLARPSTTTVAEKLAVIARQVLTPTPKVETPNVELIATGSSLGDQPLASLSGVDLAHAAPHPLSFAPPPPMPYVPAPAFTPAAWDTANPTEESADADTTPRVSRRPTPVKGAKMKLVLWIAIGLVLQLAAVGIWIFMFQDSEPEEEPTPPPTKTAPVKPGKKKQVKE